MDTPVVPQQVPPSQVLVPQPQVTGITATSSSISPWIWVLLAFVLVGLGVGLYFLIRYLRRPQPEPTPTPPTPVPTQMFGELGVGTRAPNQEEYKASWIHPNLTMTEAFAGCDTDSKCAAVMYVSQTQQAVRSGIEPSRCTEATPPPQCVASTEAYTVTSGNTVYYSPRDITRGPYLHVKPTYTAVALT